MERWRRRWSVGARQPGPWTWACHDRQNVCAVSAHPGHKLHYDCSLEELPSTYREAWLRLAPDAATAGYLARAERQRLSLLSTTLVRLASFYFSDYVVNGLLGTYPMHLASTDQWKRLIGSRPGGRLLDVGAGSGEVTRELAPLFDEVTVTETARSMTWRLSRLGYRVHFADLCDQAPPGGPFDAVALLNVLDRCQRPSALLDAALALLRPAGKLLLSLPLPYDPVAYDGPYLVDPEDPLACRGDTWTAAATSLVQDVLTPRGLVLQAITRLPYLTGGDARRALVVLDAVVVVAIQPEAR